MATLEGKTPISYANEIHDQATTNVLGQIENFQKRFKDAFDFQESNWTNDAISFIQ